MSEKEYKATFGAFPLTLDDVTRRVTDWPKTGNNALLYADAMWLLGQHQSLLSEYQVAVDYAFQWEIEVASLKAKLEKLTQN